MKVPQDIRSRERKFHRAKRPGSESSRERNGPGTKVPGNERARERKRQVPGGVRGCKNITEWHCGISGAIMAVAQAKGSGKTPKSYEVLK